jgi:hypothetical protein
MVSQSEQLGHMIQPLVKSGVKRDTASVIGGLRDTTILAPETRTLSPLQPSQAPKIRKARERQAS